MGWGLLLKLLSLNSAEVGGGGEGVLCEISSLVGAWIFTGITQCRKISSLSTDSLTSLA